jgi:hypothetical protein
MVEMCAGLGIGLERAVGHILDEPETEKRRRDAENNVFVGQLGCKVRLCQDAPGGIDAASDRVEVVDAAVQNLPALFSVAVGSLLVARAAQNVPRAPGH